MARALDADFVARYGRPPSATVVDKAISLHENVRALLGDAEYATVLQGSYKNDTALASMNDVDVLAVHRASTYTWWRSPQWDGIFRSIEAKLDADRRYKGKWTRRDRCIRLATEVNIDIVPAAHQGDPTADPIGVYSFSARSIRTNWPRGHYEKTAAKSASTSGAFKQTVRLFKRWARCRYGSAKIAPSYYLECLVYSLPDAMFSGDLAADFHALGNEILKRQGSRWTRGSLRRPFGDGDLFGGDEWPAAAVDQFMQDLQSSLRDVKVALDEQDPKQAKAAWRRAFAGHEP